MAGLNAYGNRCLAVVLLRVAGRRKVANRHSHATNNTVPVAATNVAVNAVVTSVNAKPAAMHNALKVAAIKTVDDLVAVVAATKTKVKALATSVTAKATKTVIAAKVAVVTVITVVAPAVLLRAKSNLLLKTML